MTESKLQMEEMIKERNKKIQQFQREIDIISFFSIAQKYGFVDNYDIIMDLIKT